MQRRTFGRAVLAVAGLVLCVGSLVAGAQAPRPVAPPPAVVLAPAAAVSCDLVGAYEVPDTAAVGLPAGLRLCPSGPLVVRTPGALVDGWDVSGGIVVAAADVVVRRSRVTGDGTHPFGITTTPAGSVRIEDSVVSGDFSEAGIGGGRWTAERVEITRVTHSGARLGAGSTLRNSWVHDLTPAPGAWVAALELAAPGGDTVVEGNRIDAGPGRSAALLVAGPVHPGGAAVVIRDNVLRGGEVTLRQVGGSGDPVRIVDNRFGRDAGQASLRVPAGALVAGNTFVDGGAVRVS